jgi:hypothetical protein
LKVSVPRIEKMIGYKDGESHEMISEMIGKLLEEVGSVACVKAEYAVFDDVKFDNNEKTVEFGNCVFNLQKIVFNQIRRSESIAIFLCTAGREIGILSKKAMAEGDLLTGYIYDVIGSEIVEDAADLMQNSLGLSMAKYGKKITNRYSPGYCNWNVQEQHKLFQLMPFNYCGITLTPSALMEPVKSVSGFIGIGQDVRFNAYICKICDMKECIYRYRKA